MRYEEILLTLDKEEAHKRITERVSDIRMKTTNERIEYRTNTGHLLAVLFDAQLPSGETGSKLRYRVALIGPLHAHARAQAHRTRRAVANCRAN